MQIGSAISYFLYKMKRRKSSDTSNRQRLCNTTTQPIRARAYMWLKFYSMNHWRQFQTKSRSPRVNERNCLQKISPISTLLFKISSVRKVPFLLFFLQREKMKTKPWIAIHPLPSAKKGAKFFHSRVLQKKVVGLLLFNQVINPQFLYPSV